MERTCYRLQSLHSFPLPALVKAGQVSFGSMPIVGLKSISFLSPVSLPLYYQIIIQLRIVGVRQKPFSGISPLKSPT